LFPLPDSDEEIRIASDSDQQIIVVTETDGRVSALSALPQNSVQLERRVLINVDVGPGADFAHGKVLFVLTDSNAADASLVETVNFFLLFILVVQDGVTDTRRVNDVVAVQNFRVVPFVRVIPEEAVHLQNVFWNWTVIKDFLSVVGLVEKVLGNLL
jgi:hypothetical protein